MPPSQAACGGASCACRKRPHDGQQVPGDAGHSGGAAGSSLASGGKRRQPAAGGDSQAGPAAASVAPSAASAALPPQQQQQSAAEPEQQAAAEPEERDQQGAAPPAATQQDDEQPPDELPPPPPKLKPRRPFAPQSFYRQKAAGSSADGGSGGGGGGDNGSSVPARAPTPRELYLETQVHRLLLAAKARESSWKEAEARHGPGAQPPPEVWETYPTQQPAFDRADSLGLDVFSVEYGREGKRRFIVASRAHFWQRYSGMVQRHYYEIIRAGAPCHLYFDLEFSREDNPEVDGAAAVDALLSLLRDALRDRFGLDMQDDWALELDSSTPAKFSRHLIVRIPGAVFASNAHVGALVLQLCAAARQRRGEDERCARLLVRKGEEETLFVDPAVYSRNRAFRLYLSSKAGKQTILDSTGRFGGAGLTQRDTFCATLITEVPAGARLLRCFEGETSDEAAVAAARRALSSPAGSAGSSGASGASGLRTGPPGAIGAHASYGPCPYPELEQFVCGVCCEGGVQGRVRSWVQLEDVILFSMRDNRWCGNVGRPHKSNGIYIVVDLREGSWHQKCYDPECRHYRSPLTPLPPQLRGLWQPAAEAAGHPAAGGAAGAAAGQAACSWSDEEEDCLMAEALDRFELQRAAACTQQAQQQGPEQLQQPQQQPLQQQQEQEAQQPQQPQQQQQQQQQPSQQPQHQQSQPPQLPEQQQQQQPRLQSLRPPFTPLQPAACVLATVGSGGPAARPTAVGDTAARGCADSCPAGSAAANASELAQTDADDDAMLLEGLLQYERQAAAAAPAVVAAQAASAAAAQHAAGEAAAEAELAGQRAAQPTVQPASVALATREPLAAAAAPPLPQQVAAVATPSSNAAAAAVAAAAASPATWPGAPGSLRSIFLRPNEQQQGSAALQSAVAGSVAMAWQQQQQQQQQTLQPQQPATAPQKRKLEVWEKFL